MYRYYVSICTFLHTYLKPTYLSAWVRHHNQSILMPHGVENGSNNLKLWSWHYYKVSTNSTTTTTVLDPACLNQVCPNETTSWWNHVGWTSASTSTGTTASTLTRPLDDVAVISTVANASQELKPTTPSTAIWNANSGLATVMGLHWVQRKVENDVLVFGDFGLYWHWS